MDCPDEMQLRSFLDGRLHHDQLTGIQGHVGECDRCQSAMERLIEDVSLIPTPPSSLDVTQSANWSYQQRDRLAKLVQAELSAANEAEDTTLPIQLGDYELLEVLGEGGMGVVYRARQTSLNRIVAVKVVGHGRFAKRSFIDRFFLEAESAAKLNHPGIVPIYDVGEAQGQVFYTMAHVPGGSLAESLVKKPYGSPRAAQCLRAISEAIAYAHEQGVIHRDLKPANILLDDQGQPKVADFGLAKQLDADSSLTITGEVLGTPSYMPPEQARVTEAEVSAAGDVYSLGAILFHMLTGRPPFVAVEPVDVLHQLIHDEPIRPRQLNPAVHPDLETIALKCLAKSPAQRYLSADELVEELDRFLNGKPILARPIGRLQRAWRWCRRNPAVASLSASVFVVLVIGSMVSTGFGLLASQRAGELEAVNDDLIEARNAATRSAQDAQVQADLATAQTDKAIRVLETMLFDLQAPYRADAAAQEERRNLLSAVLTELDGIPEDKLYANRIKRLRANAIQGLADVETQSGDSKASAEVSAEYYRRAIVLFEELCESEPTNPDHLLDLADALWEFGDTYGFARQWAPANELFLRALELGERAAEIDPDNFAIQRALAQFEVYAGESSDHLGDLDRGLTLLQRGLERSRKQIEKGDSHRSIYEALAGANLNLGDYYVHRGDVDKSASCFEAFRDAAKELADRYPLDYALQMDYSTAFERLGDVSLRRGNMKLACEQYEMLLRLSIDLGLAAPDNDQIQWDVSFAYQKVADGYFAYGEFEKARDNAIKCAEMRRKLLHSSPHLVIRCVKLNHALITAARSHAKLGELDSAAACYRQAIEAATEFQIANNTNRFQAQIKNYESRLAQIDRQLVAER